MERSQRTVHEQDVYITRTSYEQRVMSANVHMRTLNEHYKTVHECS